LAGAQERVSAFYAYKSNEKNMIIELQLALEALFHNLAERLSHHNRPPFQPAKGTTLEDFSKNIQYLRVVILCWW
jgi:hypothetical protein